MDQEVCRLNAPDSSVIGYLAASKNALVGARLARLKHIMRLNRVLRDARLRMKSSRFEPEAPRFFPTKSSLELVHTKNVIELSVLHRGRGA
jgi:hypothetical protein